MDAFRTNAVYGHADSTTLEDYIDEYPEYDDQGPSFRDPEARALRF